MQFKRRISLLGLLIFSINGCLGSGWLFAPLFAAKIAGVASIISWLIGGIIIILIALPFVEAAVMVPVPGVTARLPLFTHGKMAGFLIGWLSWLALVTIPPIEVLTILQYSATYLPILTYTVNGVTTLTATGLSAAATLLLLLSLVNAANYKGLLYSNFLLFAVKTGILIVVIIAIAHIRFLPANFSGFNVIFTQAGWHEIFAAIAGGGILIGLTFKHAVDLVGEVTHPERSIPLVLIGSIVICLLLYIALQIVFIGALDPALLKNGWQHLTINDATGPLLGLVSMLGVIWLARLLFINAIVSPLGCGLVYAASGARVIYSMSKTGYLPGFLAYLNLQGLPVLAVVFNFIINMLMFLLLAGWQQMADFFIAATALTFAVGPVAVLCLRRQLSGRPLKFRLRPVIPLCFIAFYGSNLMVFWSGWSTLSKLAVGIFIGMLIFVVAYSRGRVVGNAVGLKAFYWLLPYLLVLVLLSYLGTFGGGRGIIPFGWDFLVLGIFSAVFLYIAVITRLPAVNLNEQDQLAIDFRD